MIGTLLSRLHIRLLILILVSAAPAFGIIVYSGIEQRAQALVTARKQALAIVQGITARQLEQIKLAQAMLESLSLDTELLNAVREGSCGRFLAKKRSNSLHFEDFFVADTHGRISCSVTPSAVGLNVNDRSYFRRAIESGGFSVGDYQISRISGKSAIFFAHPVFNEWGGVEAIIAIGLDIAWLGDLVSSSALPESSILTLVDAGGTIIARTPDTEGWVGRSVPDRPAFLEATQRGLASYEAVWLDEVRRVTYVTSLYSGKSGSIYVRLGVPKSALFDDIDQSLMRNALLMLAALACALLLGWFAAERLVLRRVRYLTETAQRFGTGDLELRPDADSRQGELGALAGALDEMAVGLKKHQELVVRMSTRDALTNLPNRGLFLDRAAQAIAFAARHERCVALAMVSIDRLDVINDSLGASHGDELLIAVGQRLVEVTRNEDTVARFEGAEFAMLLGDIPNSASAVTAVTQLASAFDRVFSLKHGALHVTASIGVVLFPDDGDNVSELVKHAHAAVHRLQLVGGGGVQFYTPQMSADAAERLRLEQSMRLALQREEFELHYQPKVDLKTGAMSGVEALIRWRHPDFGMISPARFIPLAEETGLIVPIGEWVLRTACAQIVRWQTMGLAPVSVAVNLSARQFWHGGIAGLLKSIIADTGVPASLLELEVTESAVMQNIDATIASLHELRELGASISIDDFGTGYSSLGYLRRLPLNKLKIDRSFVSDLTHDPSAALLTRQIIAIAHALHLTVIAEGVEHVAELAFLAQNDCDQIQGYYCSRPVPAAEISHFLAENKRWVFPVF